MSDSLILYGSASAPNNEAERTHNILCIVYYCVGCVTYNKLLQQKVFYKSKPGYLVVTENKLSQKLWNGNRKYLAFPVMVAISLIIFSPIFFYLTAGMWFTKRKRHQQYASYQYLCPGIHSNNFSSPDIYLLLFHFLEHLQNASLNRHR